MKHHPLIELTRGDALECQHLGSVAVVNTEGRLVAHVGDPYWLTFSRSTLKALQALPFMEAGGPAQFGFNTRQLAVMCASHNGEDMHVAETQTMLEKAGLTYKALRCGCHTSSRSWSRRRQPAWCLTSAITTAAASTPAFWRTACSTA